MIGGIEMGLKMKNKLLKNRTELLRELLRIAELDECRNSRIFALALAYIICDICPNDRTTNHIEKRSFGDYGD
jgi:hypothetical protein